MVMGRTETAVSIVTCGDKLILLKRKSRSGDPWSGDMCFPGGFIKDGEQHVEAALRELEEETSIDIHNLRVEDELPVFHPVRSPNVNVYPFWFVMDNCMDIVPGDEIERGGWYRIGRHEHKHDNVKGDYVVWYGDVVWGLTFRIYTSFVQHHMIH
jgi:ADP-ribose pyrophosphatase